MSSLIQLIISKISIIKLNVFYGNTVCRNKVCNKSYSNVWILKCKTDLPLMNNSFVDISAHSYSSTYVKHRIQCCSDKNTGDLQILWYEVIFKFMSIKLSIIRKRTFPWWTTKPHLFCDPSYRTGIFRLTTPVVTRDSIAKQSNCQIGHIQFYNLFCYGH